MSIALLELHDHTPRRVPCDATSLAAAAADEPPNGVYLVARTWRGGRVLDLDAHFDRMTRSALELGHALDIPRGHLRTLLDEERRYRQWRDVRFRVTAVLDAAPWYRLALEPAQPVLATLRRDGVYCVTAMATRAQPRVKSTAWLRARETLGAADREGPAPYETLLVDPTGRVLEGASSNFYAVLDGVLHTAGAAVLEGTARRIVLAIADGRVPIRLEAPTLGQLSGASEAVISSSTRGIVPVRRIDALEIGPPGAVTATLIDAYDAWLAAHLEPLAGDAD